MKREREWQYERLERELEELELVELKSVLNRIMYSWVVHFLNYFISISERDMEPEKGEGRGTAVLIFFM